MRTVCGKLAVVCCSGTMLSLAFCAVAAAQTASACATATVVLPLTLNKVSDLGFGRVIAGENSGTVTLDTTGKRTATGGVVLANGSDATAAVFTVNGQQGLGYTVLLPKQVALRSGAEALPVDSFIHEGGPLTGTATQLRVGATVHVAPHQPVGLYGGVFEVTVSYN
ncbi:MAG: DUF4402 domain-containing protein [Armatimonadota bacterium]